jgi:hypothetical protein
VNGSVEAFAFRASACRQMTDPTGSAGRWVLLEERVRDASAFCRQVIESVPALAPVQQLDAVAGSLAAHFADWSAVSRFAKP